MNLFSRILALFRGPNPGWTYPGSPRIPLDVRVSPTEALQVSAVAGCCTLISNAVAGSPAIVYQQTPTGRTPLPTDDLHYLLNLKPNPETTSLALRQALVLSALIHGNGYAAIERDVGGRVVALTFVDPRTVTPSRDADGRLIYRVTEPAGQTRELEPRDVFHLRAPVCLDSLDSISPVRLAVRTASLGAALERAVVTLFENGVHPSGILAYTKKPSDKKTAKAEAKAFKQAFASVGRTGDPVVTYGDAKWTQLDAKLVDAESVAHLKALTERVAQTFNLPVAMLSEAGSQGYGSNQNSFRQHFRDFTVRPWTLAFEAECNLKLIPWRAPRFVELDLSGLVRGSDLEQAQADTQRLNNGTRCVNELRKRDLLPPVEGGDVYRVANNLVDIDAPEPEPQPEPETQPDKSPEPDARLLALRLALDAHAKRYRARSRDVPAAKLSEAREQLRAQLADDLEGFVNGKLPGLAEAVEAGADPFKVAQHFLEAK